jgi:choline-sulfatase
MNLVFIFSDEHNKAMMGCHGHPVVRTPHLDRLAARGTRFTNAYCNHPICVPSRASLATGRYSHKIQSWDNSTPYIGEVPSWGHRLTAQGHHVTTIGKLHYAKTEDDTGFPDQRIPLHVVDGIGDLFSLIREDMPPRPSMRAKIVDAGPGESSYTRYDRGITEEAQRYFLEKSQSADEKPWAVFISYVTPHFPLITPQEFYDLYPLDQVVLPKQYAIGERPTHPVLEEFRRVMDMRDTFDEHTIRKAVAAYYGLCSFMDAQVGAVVETIEQCGLAENTRIIYSSDHGDTLGDYGMWFKHTMYEGSAGVPLIIAGPDIPQGVVNDVPVSLVDGFPTIVEAVGAELMDEDLQHLDGISLLPIARGESRPNRTMFSEYHAAASCTGYFMIRKDQYKYVHYVGYAPQLFDLAADPDELIDLAEHEAYQDIVQMCERELRSICDPDAVNQQAFTYQRNRIEASGGRQVLLDMGNTIPYSPVPKKFQ